MAKRKKATPAGPASTAELAPDTRNPRYISEVASGGLSKSLDTFGDLSGIVWNRRTSQLVAGHQRVDQIHARWGTQPIEIIDAERELGIIRVDDEHCFTVRIVDWPPEKQAAANVAANNPKIQGEFTGDVVAYIRDIESLLAETSPGLMDDLLLVDLLADYQTEPTKLTKLDVKPPPAMTWVLVGISTPRFGRIAELVDQMAGVPDIVIETTFNDAQEI